MGAGCPTYIHWLKYWAKLMLLMIDHPIEYSAMYSILAEPLQGLRRREGCA